MHVTAYDPVREPAPAEPDKPSLTFTPFRTLSLTPRRELRLELTEREGKRALSVRLWRSAGRDRPLQPEHPWHLHPEHLPALIAVLTEAAVDLGAMPAASAAFGAPVPSAPGCAT